jgi:hypothetical protein
MPTLTGTGAVNLTTATNWSPAQIPAPGDDLIIGNATLTLDADFTANTVTFANASSRIDWASLPRNLTATNGFFITGNLGASSLAVQSLSAGTLTLVGRWTVTAGNNASGRIATVNGGTLILRTVGGSQSAVLFEVTGNTLFSLINLSAGEIQTTGRLLFSTTNTSYYLANASGGKWTHNSIGSNSFTASFASRFYFSGTASLDFYGDLAISGNTIPFRLENGHTGTLRFFGAITTTGLTDTAVFNPLTTAASALYFFGNLDSAVQIVIGGNNSSVFWQNASVTISAGKYLRFGQRLTLVSNITIDNFGLLAFFGGVTAVGNPVAINQRTANAQFWAGGGTNFDGLVLPFQTAAPTLPAVQNVAAGTVYGYAGFTQTGTGLILDPAVLASAVGSSLTPVTDQLDDIETTLGDIQAKTDTIGTVDLTPVTEQLDDIETTLGDIQAKTDTIGTVDLTPVTEQLDDIETTLGEIQAKTDTIAPVDLSPVTTLINEGAVYFDERIDDIETTLGDIQAKTDTITPPSTGPHRLTITATDDGDQLAGALVRILGVAGTLRTTEADAPSLIDLGPGTYTLRITPPALFDAPADIPVTLPGPSGDVALAIPLTRAAIIPPAAGNLCAVAIRIANPSDTPVASATVRAYLVTGPLLVDTIHAGKTTDTTNAAGLATLHLLRSQTYDLEAQIGDTLVTIRRTIPNAPNAVLSATLPA